MLVPQADGYSRESVHEFLTQVAQENLLQSWRETMLMVHKQPTKLPTQRPVTSVSGRGSMYICNMYNFVHTVVASFPGPCIQKKKKIQVTWERGCYYITTCTYHAII